LTRDYHVFFPHVSARTRLLRLCKTAVGFDLRLGLRHGQRPHTHFQPLIAQFTNTMIVLTATGLHAKAEDPANMQAVSVGHGTCVYW